MAEFVHVERGDDGVAVLRLERPPANALSVAVLGEIAEAARGLTADPPGAVVVTGGDKIFAAGADISEFGGPEEAARIAGHFREAFDAVAAAFDGTLADGLSTEQELFVQGFETDDAKIGVQSFLENGPGKAAFTGR